MISREISHGQKCLAAVYSSLPIENTSQVCIEEDRRNTCERTTIEGVCALLLCQRRELLTKNVSLPSTDHISLKIRPMPKISPSMIFHIKKRPSTSASRAWPSLHKTCLPGASLIFPLPSKKNHHYKSALAPGTLTPSPYRGWAPGIPTMCSVKLQQTRPRWGLSLEYQHSPEMGPLLL